MGHSDSSFAVLITLWRFLVSSGNLFVRPPSPYSPFHCPSSALLPFLPFFLYLLLNSSAAVGVQPTSALPRGADHSVSWVSHPPRGMRVMDAVGLESPLRHPSPQPMDTPENKGLPTRVEDASGAPSPLRIPGA